MYDKLIKFSVTGKYGCGPDGEDDVYTVDEFKNYCKSGSFIDYDGFGFPVKENLADKSIWIQPSNIKDIPKDATHIIWYNR